MMFFEALMGEKGQLNGMANFQTGRLTDRVLVIERRKKFGTGEKWQINLKWPINWWPIKRNPLYTTWHRMDNVSDKWKLYQVFNQRNEEVI